MSKSQKGDQFEREVSKELSLWWTEGERDDVFWRCSQSGGRATERRKKGLDTAYSQGDLTFIDPVGKPLIDYFIIELKRGYTNEIDPLSLLDKLDRSKQNTLFDWVDKAEKEKESCGRKEIMILFKRDRHKPCILLSEDETSRIIHASDLLVDCMCLPNRYCIVRFQEFLDFVPSEYYKDYLKWKLN